MSKVVTTGRLTFIVEDVVHRILKVTDDLYVWASEPLSPEEDFVVKPKALNRMQFDQAIQLVMDTGEVTEEQYDRFTLPLQFTCTCDSIHCSQERKETCEAASSGNSGLTKEEILEKYTKFAKKLGIEPGKAVTHNPDRFEKSDFQRNVDSFYLGSVGSLFCQMAVVYETDIETLTDYYLLQKKNAKLEGNWDFLGNVVPVENTEDVQTDTDS